MTDNTIDGQGASEKPQSGNKPLSKQVDNLIVEIELGLDVLNNADLILENQVAREFGPR